MVFNADFDKLGLDVWALTEGAATHVSIFALDPTVTIFRKGRLYKLAIGLLLVVNFVPFVAGFSELRPILCIASGTIATISGVAIIPVRTTTEAPSWSWILTYLIWVLAKCSYACLQWLDIPARYRRLYLFSFILLTGHFTVALSQSINSISDAATIYGPLLLTICEFLMALLYQTRHTPEQSLEGETPTLGAIDMTSIITTVIGV
ncbi:hypothetical protein B0T11DRAFT_350946 [Plectosphaerella cucumerina]|uniref:Uncharacterized protein n=1 Tax=Plectosphaerella cucumerina TaxID=40658 RepID=A0A8K0TM05_9PEZI|nr:hypothetical protein B0T11DRAFT_350946 [Plectosphaerella cucumerina]